MLLRQLIISVGKVFGGIANRKTENILKFLDKVKRQINIKSLLCYSAKENISNEVIHWCKHNGITSHVTYPYHYQSNCRIKCFNRTLMEGINKHEQC